jgi:hypothetical protein
MHTSKVLIRCYGFHLCLNIEYKTQRHVCLVGKMGVNVGFKLTTMVQIIIYA